MDRLGKGGTPILDIPDGRMHQGKTAFTLIELLIVVAIIGILAAIAVPNFLNAQARAKTSRARSDIRNMEQTVTLYILDNGKRPIDCDDPGADQYFGGMPCGRSGVDFPAWVKDIPEFGSASRFMSFAQYKIFTTPIAYMTSPPMDAFCGNCALSYNTRFSSGLKQSESYTFSSIGADKMTGDWGFFYLPATSYRGAQYDPSNGIISRGDIYVANVSTDPQSGVKPGRYGFQ